MQRGLQFFRQLHDKLNRMPGVISATLAVMPLLDGNEWDSSVTVEGYSVKQGEWINPHMQFVSPGYFATLTSAPTVLIVNGVLLSLVAAWFLLNNHGVREL